MKRLALLTPLAALAFAAACSDTPISPLTAPPSPEMPPNFAVGHVSGASYTSTNQIYDDGNKCLNGPGLVNCNLYMGKEYVWISGGPTNGQSALSDGTYFFVVGVPGGENSHINDQDPVGSDKNLSDDWDSYLNRRFVVENHHIVAYLVDSDDGTVDHVFDDAKIRLFPYTNTSNPGGEYFVAICRIDDNPSYNEDDRTYDASTNPVDPNNCKYDNFKVRTDGDQPKTPSVKVTKTAVPYFERTYQWKVEKSVDHPTITLAPGETKTTKYTVTYTSTGSTDGAWKVSGKITVTNTGSVDATVTSVIDDTGWGEATLSNCPDFPATLAPDEELTCDYEQTLTAPPSIALNTSYDNTAHAFIDDPLGDTDLEYTGTKAFKFETPSEEIDRCITVSDTFEGSTVEGSVCAGDSPKRFEYSRTFGPYSGIDACGTTKYPNTASFTTEDTGATGSANANVTVTVQCQGCTPGFWKNNTAGWSQTTYKTGDLIKSPFTMSTADWGAYPKPKTKKSTETLGDYTLLEGLGYQGGSTLTGKGEILLRAGVAALLNASWKDGTRSFSYPLTAPEVIAKVTEALASKDPNTVTGLASKLDGLNNQGCPLNAKGKWVG